MGAAADPGRGGFLPGGRKLGGLVAAISASASSSSAWTLLGVSGFAYSFGLSAIWLFPACVGGFWFNWKVIAPRLRPASAEAGAVTLTDFLAHGLPHEQGRWLRWIASLIVAFSLTAYVASQFQAAGLSFSETFAMAEETAIAVGAAVILVYTLLGGFWAVSLTDTLQGLVMAAAAVILPVAALMAVAEGAGFGAGLRAVEDPHYLSLTHGMPVVAGLGFVLGLLGIGLGYPGQPHVVNRFMALSGEKALRNGRRIAMSWAIIIYTGMIVLGLAGRILFASMGNDEAVFFRAANELFPAVFAGIIVAASLSAIMSTADSQLLVAASSLTHDLRKESAAGASSPLLWSRLVVLGLSVLAVLLALWLDESIFNSVLFAWSAMGAAFGPLLLVLLLGRQVPASGRVAAMLLGFGLSVGAYFLNLELGGVFKTEAGAFLERVVPFAAAFGVAWGIGTRPRY
jgi:sodium/proline symporter